MQLYLKKVREGGGVVSAQIVMTAARGILLTCERLMLVEFGGYIELNRHWVYSLLHRINFVQRKVTTAIKKCDIADFKSIKGRSFEGCPSHSGDGRIDLKLGPYWDQDRSKQHLDSGAARC